MSSSLKYLEEQSIDIISRILSLAENPVMLYSIGKDSSVLLHLLRKIFYPSKMPIKVLHIDTGWKFKEMIEFRNYIANKYCLDLEVFKNPVGEEKNITPFNNKNYTEIMKTAALKTALNKGEFDFIFGGARRDEESSRSKERVLSHRDVNHKWEPKNQRIEPWYLFNSSKNTNETFRVFPLSNWTEFNIWNYINEEEIEIVPLYFSKKRPVVNYKNQLILVDDERIKFEIQSEIENKQVRFRTLGCYPLTSAIESDADNISKIIKELNSTEFSERSGRLIDTDREGSMEIKKKDGYF